MLKESIKLSLFIIIGWISAFTFEEIPRTLLHQYPNIKHLWELGSGWSIFFLIWYGLVFTTFYFLFIRKQIKHPIIWGILFGLVVETFYFKEMKSLLSLIIFIPTYAGLFYIPLKVHEIIWGPKKRKIGRI
jgi:hypothetical protein